VRKSRDGKRTSLFARALAGGDVVSFNLYRLRSGEDSLRPCEMPAEKVGAFDLGYRRSLLPLAARRDAVAACATCLDLRMAVRTVTALFPAAMETIRTCHWKISSRAAINGYH
jgi:hypothetical protein